MYVDNYKITDTVFSRKLLITDMRLYSRDVGVITN